MLRAAILSVIFFSGYFTLFSARADSCSISGAGNGGFYLNVPQLAIPADTPDGTVLYTSPKINSAISCEAGSYSSVGTAVNIVTTSDFNQFVAQNNGVKFTLYIDGVAYDRQKTQFIGYTSTGSYPSFRKNISIWYDIKVDSSKGKIPVSGTYLSGSFESIYIMLGSNYGNRKGIIVLTTPNITYIPCTMAVSVHPETIDFGSIKSGDLDKGMKFQRKFSTLIQKNKGCTLAVSAPFGINMYFEPTVSTLNADGSLNLNNGLGLSIADTSGKYVPYNTAWKIDDVKVDSILRNNFTANLLKIAGQDVKTGPFSADVVVKMNYY